MSVENANKSTIKDHIDYYMKTDQKRIFRTLLLNLKSRTLRCNTYQIPKQSGLLTLE